MIYLKKLVKDERAGGSISLIGLTVILMVIFSIMVVIEIFHIGTVYTYIKTQMDLSNRGVYAELDAQKLADRQIYIDELAGQDKFYYYLGKNLNLDSSLVPEKNQLGIVGAVKVTDFQIYNEDKLPAVTSTGTQITQVSVFTKLEVQIKPIFFGKFGTITINPYIVTDIPNKLIKNN